MIRCLQIRRATIAYFWLVVAAITLLLGNPLNVMASDWVRDFEFSQTSLEEIVIPPLPEPGQLPADPHAKILPRMTMHGDAINGDNVILPTEYTQAVLDALALQATPPPPPPPAPAAEDEEGNTTGNGDGPPQVGKKPPKPLQSQSSQDGSYGQAPEDNSLAFLRTATPLLAPNQWAFDYGLAYTWREFDGLTILPDGSLSTGRLRTRQLTSPFAVRYGWSRRLQLFADLPIGLAHEERADIARDEFTRVFGAGDLTLGFSYLLREEDASSPAIIANISGTLPTGADGFEESPGAAALGSGFWAINANVLFVKSVDPAVLFAGFGYSHQFDHDVENFTINPGELINYQFGSGFSINDTLTLSTVFFGAYQGNAKIDGFSISNSTQEPLAFRTSLVITKSRYVIYEPYVTIGLNSDTPDADFGVVITRRKQGGLFNRKRCRGKKCR